MLYLLDANILIDANRYYYPVDRVPEFWDWLAEMGNRGLLKLPVETLEEVMLPRSNRADAVVEWLRENLENVLLGEEVRRDLVELVTDEGYANDLTDAEVEKLGRDPFLIAYALVDVVDRCVVTNEISKPKKTRANRHIPDVCNAFNIDWCNTFALIRHLDFRTGWISN